MRILDEIEQYLPTDGRILDAGCGFGLFALYYALRSPGRVIQGYDLNNDRIDIAKTSAIKLGLSERTTFVVEDVVKLQEPAHHYDAVYMLDILHHVSPVSHIALLENLYRFLKPGGILVLKDIDSIPRWKVWFTWILDMLMNPKSPPYYADRDELRNTLIQIGFDVKLHALPDILPYAHALYICRKNVTCA
jgi:2-polyprenyl-3-methyl-5-hydroxy-6-metoxy-1,4-benzoquinol methylase